MTRLTCSLIAGLLVVLLLASTVAFALPVTLSFMERFTKNSPSSCTTCNQCSSCSEGSSYSFQKNTPASIQDKMTLISSFKGLNVTPSRTRTSHNGWNAITNPPFGCPAGKCV